ncbi:MAG: hypothetical protein S4CHLAM6_13860 [Chlamydiae bacterium]|nr:hypothetical protein [Chlamydiota bacterium]
MESFVTTKSLTDSSFNIQNHGCATANPRNHIGGINRHHPELIAATLKEDAEKVKLLVEQGENINCTSNNGGFSGHMLGEYTPIVVAVIKGNKEIVQILWEANANSLKGSYYCKNALEWAEELHHKEIADILNQASKNASKQESAISRLFFGCSELFTRFNNFF